MTFNQSDFQNSIMWLQIMHTFVCIKNLVHTFSETIIQIWSSTAININYQLNPRVSTVSTSANATGEAIEH